MANSKGSYKYEQFFPVAYHIPQAKRCNKENMIQAIEIRNMLNAHWKEYAEITHARYCMTRQVYNDAKLHIYVQTCQVFKNRKSNIKL